MQSTTIKYPIKIRVWLLTESFLTEIQVILAKLISPWSNSSSEGGAWCMLREVSNPGVADDLLRSDVRPSSMETRWYFNASALSSCASSSSSSPCPFVLGGFFLPSTICIKPWMTPLNSSQLMTCWNNGSWSDNLRSSVTTDTMACWPNEATPELWSKRILIIKGANVFSCGVDGSDFENMAGRFYREWQVRATHRHCSLIFLPCKSRAISGPARLQMFPWQCRQYHTLICPWWAAHPQWPLSN